MTRKADPPFFGSEELNHRRMSVPPAGATPARSLAKAVSWRVIGTLDTLLLSFLILTFLAPFFGVSGASHAENAATASYIAITEVITKMALYYGHERLWAMSQWGIGHSHRTPGRTRETARRSAVKTATWRVTASLDTMLLALIFTGNLGTAISIGGLEVITKLVLYFFHERAWSRVAWGSTG